MLKVMEFILQRNDWIWLEGCGNPTGGQRFAQLRGLKVHQVDFIFNNVCCCKQVGIYEPIHSPEAILRDSRHERNETGGWWRGEHWLFGMQWFSGWTPACGTHYPTVKRGGRGDGGRGTGRVGFFFFEILSRILNPVLDLSVKVCLYHFEAFWRNVKSIRRNDNGDHPRLAEP